MLSTSLVGVFRPTFSIVYPKLLSINMLRLRSFLNVVPPPKLHSSPSVLFSSGRSDISPPASQISQTVFEAKSAEFLRKLFEYFDECSAPWVEVVDYADGVLTLTVRTEAKSGTFVINKHSLAKQVS